MVLIKCIRAGLVALAGAIILLLLLALSLAYVVVPILAHVRALAGTGSWVGGGMIAISLGHVAAVAAVIFLLGFGWECRRVKARQAN
jgi:hypothetical protein